MSNLMRKKHVCFLKAIKRCLWALRSDKGMGNTSDKLKRLKVFTTDLLPVSSNNLTKEQLCGS